MCPVFLTRRLLLDVGGYVEQWLAKTRGEGLQSKLTAARQRLAAAGCAVPAIEARTRFAWVRSIVAAAVAKPAKRPVTFTDKLDKILTHRVWGTAIFLGVMFLMFQSIFLWAKPVMESIDGVRESAAKGVESAMAAGPLRALVVDGIIKGVGSVLVFLPQIVILFGFIAFLEDCGYMARAAFLMDRLMSRCGLSGKSFIPVALVGRVRGAGHHGNACDRKPPRSPGHHSRRAADELFRAAAGLCAAHRRIHDGAVMPRGLPGLVLFGLYMIGFTVAPVVALLLKRTLLRGETPVFVMELPAYRRPKFLAVLRRMYDAGRAFVVRAGTFILAAMILVWALLYFPHTDTDGKAYDQRIAEAEKAAKDSEPRRKELKEKEEPSPAEKAELETTRSPGERARPLEWRVEAE